MEVGIGFSYEHREHNRKLKKLLEHDQFFFIQKVSMKSCTVSVVFIGWRFQAAAFPLQHYAWLLFFEVTSGAKMVTGAPASLLGKKD